MADAFTAFLNLNKPEVNGSRDTWGGKYNSDFDIIDTWAAATDLLAKSALDKRGVRNAGNTAWVPQAVAGDVSFAQPVTMAGTLAVTGIVALNGGAVIPATKALDFNPAGYFAKTAATNSLEHVMGTDNLFRIMNNAYTAEAFKVTPTGLTFGGDKTVWHSGNFTPANYADKTSTTRQDFAATGGILLQVLRLFVSGGGDYSINPLSSGLQISDGARTVQYMMVSPSGAINTRELGDLNNRIETRAAAWADDRIATYSASVVTNYLNKATATSQYMNANLEIGKAFPELYIHYPAVKRGRWWMNGSGVLAWGDQSGTDHVTISGVGAIWTQQLGDLNTRIEQRCYDFSEDRLATATTRINNKTLRFLYAGDLAVGWNLGGFNEPYTGAFITTRQTDTGGPYQLWTSARWRYIQMSDSNGTWYGIGWS